MNRAYIITFSLSVIILFSIAAVLLMIVLPDQVGILDGNAEKYDSIVKSRYTFESTKNITTDITKKDYVVTSDQISNYQENYLYVPGNSDPFSPKITDVSNYTENGETSSTNGSSQTTNSNTTTTTTSSSADEAKQKTANSNGGVENPESSGK